MAPTAARVINADEVLREILEARIRVPLDRSALIAVTGIDGCGKGHMAEEWRRRLQGQGVSVALIGVDGWLNLPVNRFGGPDPAEHFYLNALRFEEMFSSLIFPLRDRRWIHLEADFAEETATAYRKEIYDFENVDVILLEGIYLLKRSFQGYYDASFWIDCTFETALERGIRRSQEGLAAEQTAAVYRSVYFPAQRIHFERDDPRDTASGIVINDPALKAS